MSGSTDKRTGSALEATLLQKGGDTAPRQRRLRVVVGGRPPWTFDLTRDGCYALGRGEEWREGVIPCPVDDAAISREHAAVHVGATVQVEDRGSTNGTWVRGRRLDPGERADLLPGDLFSLGAEVYCVFEAPQPASRAEQLWTFTYFEGRLADECRLAASRRSSFAVIHVRVEGVPAADFAARLADAAGSGAFIAVDAPGRYFVLRATPLDAASEGSRLQRALADGGHRVRVGVARFPSDGHTPDQLIAAARDATSATSATSATRPPPAGLVIENERMRGLYGLLDRVAKGSISVLILGETGVGKEVVAREVHVRSQRAKGPYQAINCAALPETLVESELFGHTRGAFTGAQQDRPGIFERAQGGTVFLDEIGELPVSVQVKLLRVLETRTIRRLGGSAEVPFDARIVAATNRDLERDVEASGSSKFRADLFFRLNGFPVTIPPLRERADEIEPLALSFAEAVIARDGLDAIPELSRDALDALRAYAWPGNIRELRNVIERAVFLAGVGAIEREHLPEKVLLGGRAGAPPSAAPPKEASDWPRLADVIDAAEAEHVRKTLERCGWNQTRAAVLLDVSRMTLITKMKKYGVRAPGR